MVLDYAMLSPQGSILDYKKKKCIEIFSMSDSDDVDSGHILLE